MMLQLANNSPQVPLDVDDLQRVTMLLSGIVDADRLCIAQNVLGGALQDEDLHFWENHALTAQTACRVGITWSDVLTAIREAGYSAEADLLDAKARAARGDAEAHYARQKAQDEAKVKDALETGVSSTVNLAENILIGVAAVAVGIAIVAAVVYAKRAADLTA